MTSCRGFIIFLIFHAPALLKGANTGYFWHVTDLHLDPRYNTSGVDSCAPGPAPGPLGDHRCDSPWRLIEGAIAQMKTIDPSPDFVLWTGDDTPHVNESTLSEDIVLNIVKNLTDEIKRNFPKVKLYPTLGNHDYLPKNQLPPRNNTIYTAISDMWGDSFPDEKEKARFQEGAYYSVLLNPKLRLALLNTNLYYKSNKVVSSTNKDPAGQFQWLQELKDNASRTGEKILVAAHIPPGLFEKHPHFPWMPEERVVRLTELLTEGDVIDTALFGHHHTDTFRILKDSAGKVTCSVLIAPGVTPWATTLPGVLGSAAGNPGVRRVQYDKDTGRVLDYTQYYTDIEQANKAGYYNWTKLYSWKEAYGLQDLSPNNLEKLAENMRTDDAAFNKYINLNDMALASRPPCSTTCRAVHCCSMIQVNEDDFDACVEELKDDFTSGASFLASSGAFVVIIAVISFTTKLYL